MNGFEERMSSTDDAYYVSEEWTSLSKKLALGEARPPEFGPLRLDSRSGVVRASDTGESVRLTASQYQILWLLVRAKGHPVSLSEIGEFLYRDQGDEKDLPDLANVIGVHIFNLRKKLEKITPSVYIPSQNEQGRRGHHQYQIILR